ncbi:hypothetical protein [Spirosoma gilvum]
MVWTVENYQKIDLAYLKKHGFMGPKPIYNQLGFRNGFNERIGYVDLWFPVAKKDPAQGAMLLAGAIHGEPIQLVVDMIRLESNLGKGGGQWYFICPKSGRRCRTLFFNGARFVCRQEMPGKYYDCQMESRTFKAQSQHILNIHVYRRFAEAWYNKPRSKYTYLGKPTRPMQRFNRFWEKCLNSDGILKKIYQQQDLHAQKIKQAILAANQACY